MELADVINVNEVNVINVDEVNVINVDKVNVINVDELKQHLDCSYVSPPDGYWKIIKK